MKKIIKRFEKISDYLIIGYFLFVICTFLFIEIINYSVGVDHIPYELWLIFCLINFAWIVFIMVLYLLEKSKGGKDKC